MPLAINAAAVAPGCHRSCLNSRRKVEIPARGMALWGFLLFAVLCPCVHGQYPVANGHSTRSISAEEAYTKFASRVLFLRCDLGPDDEVLASGVLVSSDGLVATNAHVVEGCHAITATYTSGATQLSFPGVLKYYNHEKDTAIIGLDAKGLPYFDLVSQSLPRIGERVYAIGNPQGLTQSISEGIASGIRQIGDASWIQHSAAISPGSSGGALIGEEGQLLGINAFLLKESQNLNFAVPVSALVQAVSDARAEATPLKFPQAKQRSAESPPTNGNSGGPAGPTALAAFKSHDYLRTIQLAEHELTSTSETAKEYTLIGASYCELQKADEAETYIRQALLQLSDDDPYRESALYCRLRILVNKLQAGRSELRPEIAQTAKRFLKSQHTILDAEEDFHAKDFAVGTLADLRDISGDWVDETGAFFRLYKTTNVHFQTASTGGYSGEVTPPPFDPNEPARRVDIMTVHLDQQGDRYSGEFRMTTAYMGSAQVLVAVKQQGSLSLQLSDDTTTLTGDIQFGAPEIQSVRFMRDWGEMHRKLLPPGRVPLHLVRR